MDSVQGTRALPRVGFPIRKSPDQSLFSSSPRLIAASHVLHRLLMPRHPPCALNNLTNTTTTTTLDKNQPEHPKRRPSRKDARVHCAVLNQQTATTPNGPTRPEPPTRDPALWNQERPCHEKAPATRFPGPRVPLPQDPTACLPPPTSSAAPFPAPHRGAVLGAGHEPAAELVSVPPSSTSQATRDPPADGRLLSSWHGPGPAPRRVAGQLLLRKEVIQPHLPVRLPCYDFVPIADPAFDGSLPQGVGPPASGVTDFRDVTGGVYKARERIHRSVADLRLLATPTSWGRVADPNPN